jgi:ABC-type nitrate/sulfonate/bicarbonate transport system permease component
LIQLFHKPIKNLNIFGHVWASLKRIFLALLFDWTSASRLASSSVGTKFKAFFSPMFDAFAPYRRWLGSADHVVVWNRRVPKILIVIFGSLASIVVNTQAGMSSVEQLYLDVGTVFHANSKQILFKIAIPSALDAIFAGVRTSTSAAWMVVLAAEMLGAKSGVGFLITRGMESIDMPLDIVIDDLDRYRGAMLAIVTQYAERLVCPWTRRRKSF